MPRAAPFQQGVSGPYVLFVTRCTAAYGYITLKVYIISNVLSGKMILQSFDELVELAEKGDNSNVDVIARDAKGPEGEENIYSLFMANMLLYGQGKTPNKSLGQVNHFLTIYLMHSRIKLCFITICYYYDYYSSTSYYYNNTLHRQPT